MKLCLFDRKRLNLLMHSNRPQAINCNDLQLHPPNDAIRQPRPPPKDQEIKEKKAMLYHLKNTLLRYESFDEVPAEELQRLCKNINFETRSNASNSEEEIQPQPVRTNNQTRTTDIRINDADTVNQVVNRSEEFCRNVYVVKLKEIIVILLVILCIVVKSNIPSSANYDMGEFSIYQTRYNKSFFGEVSQSNKQQAAGFKFLEKILGINQKQDRIKLYLPKILQKMQRKDQKELSYQKCIDSYHPICLDHRLSLYGSMNLELEDWILDRITGQERIVFESSIDYLLSIVLSAMKMKQLFKEGKPISKISLIQSQNLSNVDLNSIKLSLIENQCQHFVQIIKMQRQELDKLDNFNYVIISQEFYVHYVHPFSKKIANPYPNTHFLVYMPKGLSDTMKILIKQEIGVQNTFEIKFNYQDDTFYTQNNLPQSQLALNKPTSKFIMVLIKATKKGENGQIAGQSLPSNRATDETASNQASQQTHSLSSIPTLGSIADLSSQQRSLDIDQHPCIQQDKYDVLPIMSYYDKHVYIDTIMGFKLLVMEDRAIQYRKKGAISPQLLFFISQNIKEYDVVLFAYQLYQDDLILLTAAGTLKNQLNFFCVTPDINHPILTENLRMNGLQEMVSFAYLSIEDEVRMRKIYQQRDFTFIFTSFSYLFRDYKTIYDPSKPKIVVFYWLYDINYIDFVKSLTRQHSVLAMLQRFEKLSIEDSCMNYGLMEIRESGLEQADRTWLVVQM